MVLDYYKLREQPFGVTPDSRYLYPSATHREALASLLYGIEAGRGFVALVAKPGMGKTTLLFRALEQLQNRARVVFLFQTICTPADFLWALLADLGIHETKGSLIELQAHLNAAVTEQSRLGKSLVVVIDEAQSLDGSVLELVRMLSNFETAREKLIQIILSGQSQLADKLASPELVQLRQRVSIVANLKPFSPEETALYIDHRLRTAGYSFDTPLFTAAALALIADGSEGIPRNINNLCFNALSLGCALKRKTIDRDIVREVIADLDLEPLLRRMPPVTRLEQNRTKEATTVGSTEVGPSLLTGRFPRFAVACMILLALSVAVFQGHRWAESKASARAKSVAPPVTAAIQPSVRGKRTPHPATPEDIVHVTPGQSLYRICMESFGSCNPEQFQQVLALNPGLSNLDHIEPGQRIRVPTAQKTSEAIQAVAEQSDNVSPSESGMR